MTDVLKIDGVDYSGNIEAKGLSWERRDVESPQTVYTKNGFARRSKIASKRNISYVLSNLTRKQLAALDTSLNKTFFEATYLDIHGEQTRTFFSDEFSCILDTAYSDDGEWGEATFTMKER